MSDFCSNIRDENPNFNNKIDKQILIHCSNNKCRFGIIKTSQGDQLATWDVNKNCKMIKDSILVYDEDNGWQPEDDEY